MKEGNEIDFNIDFSTLFSKEEENLILEAIEKYGYYRIKPIKENLPSEISYDKIRFVILKKIINDKKETL